MSGEKLGVRDVVPPLSPTPVEPGQALFADSEPLRMRAEAKPDPLDIIRPFCGQGDPREWLNQPWVLDGMHGATNGHVLVVLDGVDTSLPDTEAQGLSKPQNLRTVIGRAMAANGPWHAIEPVELAPCADCHGAGKVRSEKCPDCDGEGYFDHGRHEYECRECGGVGWIKGGPDSEEVPCSLCGGTAIANGCWQPAWLAGTPHGIGHRALSLIAKLPNVEFCAGPDAKGGIPFRFVGGRGIVMPRLK